MKTKISIVLAFILGSAATSYFANKETFYHREFSQSHTTFDAGSEATFIESIAALKNILNVLTPVEKIVETRCAKNAIDKNL